MTGSTTTPTSSSTPTPDVHLVLATEQNLANLIPALQLQAREVWVLQTPKMRASGGHLAAALKARKVAVQRIDFDDRDVTTLHQQAEQVAERVAEHLHGRAITVNLTGGTKLMTLAVTQTLAALLDTGAEATRPHLVYTDTAHRRLDWLAPVPRSEPMHSVLKLDDLLLAQGYRQVSDAERADRQRAAQERADLTRWLGDQAGSLARFFGSVNALAQEASHDGRPFQPEQWLQFPPGGRAAEWLSRARDASLIDWRGDECVRFLSVQAARYMGGGWAEELVWLKAAGSRWDGGWAPGLKLEHADSGSQNELDTVLLHGNRLLVVESKAERAGHKTADRIYKLAQLSRQIGGAFAQALLVSARELRDEHRRRAGEYGVQVLCGAELSRLGAWLRDWQQANGPQR